MIQYLGIGYVTEDAQEDGSCTIGGTVSYAAVTASKLGYMPAVVTSCKPDLVIPEQLREALVGNILLRAAPSKVTTTFRNVYVNGSRQQHLYRRAGEILEFHIPRMWRYAPLVHFAPLAQELDYRLLAMFPVSKKLVTPQGWMRHWDEEGLVSLGEWEGAEEVLPHVDWVVLSDEDIRYDLDLARHYATMVGSSVVVTQGEHGATVYGKDGSEYHSPPRRTKVVDPTGAGDVFASAFALEVMRVGDTRVAADFANVVASMSVEAAGLEGIPELDRVREALRGDH